MIEKKEIEIPQAEPFKNDYFKREGISDNLTKLIESSKTQFVMSIDSAWGMGKTTFVKMWKQKLENQGNYQTIYFNAWENDDSNDPLLSIISEFMEILPKENEKGKKIKAIGKTIFKKSIPSVLKLATAGILDIENIELGNFNEKELIAMAGKFGDLNFKGYNEEKNQKKKFKKLLEDYQREENKKIIFFIDELDRCRPHFAIETLEKIKHLFDIENYYFILTVDKEQLCHSIATLYGEKMDSAGYLKKFIDYEYNLPSASLELYINYKREKDEIFKGENLKYFWKNLIIFVQNYRLTLRDVDKLFYDIKIFLSITNINALSNLIDLKYYSISVLSSLFLVLKIKKRNLYLRIIKCEKQDKVFEEINISFLNNHNMSGDRIGNFNRYDIVVKEFLKMYSIKKRNNGDSYFIGNLEEGYYFNLKDLWDGDEIGFIKELEFLDDFSFQEN